MPTLLTYTFGSGGDYPDYPTAESDTDNALTTLDQQITLKGLAGTTLGAYTSGATTDATRYRHVTAAPGAEATGYRTGTQCVFSTRIYSDEAFLRVSRLTWVNSTQQGVALYGASSLIDGVAVFNSTLSAIDLGTSATTRCLNSLVVGVSAGQAGIYAVTVGQVVYNCTAVNCVYRGIVAGSCTIRNCASVGSGSADYNVGGTGSMSHNLSSDATAPGTDSQKNKAAADTIVSAVVGSEDCKLKAGSAAISNGMDLSGSGVTVDFWATLRSVPFDIGFHEYSSDVTPPTCTITTPAGPTASVYTPLYTECAGTAADTPPGTVDHVSWSTDKGESGTATGTTSWAIASLPLHLGANVLSVIAYDAAGNPSTAQTCTITLLPTDFVIGSNVGDDYPDALTAEAATRACISLNRIVRFLFRSEEHTLTGNVLEMLSTDTDLYRYRILAQLDGARTTLQEGYGAQLRVRISCGTEIGVRVRDLQVSPIPSGVNCVLLGPSSVVERCVLVGGARGVYLQGAATSGSIVRNNAIYRPTIHGIRSTSTAGAGNKIHANTIINCHEGISIASTGTISELYGNVVLGGTVCYAGRTRAAVYAKNWSSDATGDTGCTGLTPGNEVWSVTPGSENAALKPGAACRGGGYDLSAQFTDDLLGQTRTVPWDAGAEKYLADTAGPVLSVTDPADPFTTLNPDHPFVGTADDLLSGVDSVRWETDGGGSGNCSGTTNFSATIPFVWGENVVTVIAKDLAGYETEEEVTVTLARISKPTLALTATPTGFTAALSTYDPGTTNTLWVGQADGSFVSKGSTWVGDEIDVVAGSGRWYAFVISESSNQSNVSDVEMVKSLDLAWQLKTGVTRAATGVR